MKQQEMLKRMKETQRGSVFYTTRYKREYKFLCLSKYKNEDAFEYSIPHRVADGFATRKIRVSHILKALSILLKKGFIQRNDLKGNDCGNNCNFCVFFGMIDPLFSKMVEKTPGKISLIKNTK